MAFKRFFVFIGLISLGFSWAHLALAEEEGGSVGKENLKKATFAGGCFWCMEPPFDKVPGVKETIVGYAGGRTEKPTYEEVSGGGTGHAEAVEVLYDPEKTSYEALLNVFWRSIDPTTKDKQFADVGDQYRSAIFYHDEVQKKEAIESKEKLAASQKFDKPIVTEIVPARPFYRAEEYHQDYYMKNPARYKTYRFFSGRGPYLKKKWGKGK